MIKLCVLSVNEGTRICREGTSEPPWVIWGDRSPDRILWSFALTVLPGEKPHEIDAGSETTDKRVVRLVRTVLKLGEILRLRKHEYQRSCRPMTLPNRNYGLEFDGISCPKTLPYQVRLLTSTSIHGGCRPVETRCDLLKLQPSRESVALRNPSLALREQ